MKLFLNGLGIVSACGRGVDSLCERLQSGWNAPLNAAIPQGGEIPVYALPPGTLEDKSLGRKVRRADRLSKMALFAAADALAEAQIPADTGRGRIGLIVTSALGSHVTTFQFLDEILTYGDAGVSPTVFSHSVQNAAAAYITSALDLQGPSLTLTQVHFAFHHGILLAEQWLREGSCDHVLLGGMDELGSVLEWIWNSMRPIAQDGKIRPFGFGPRPASVPGEGSAFLVLSARPGPNACATLNASRPGQWSAPEETTGLHLLEADGTLEDESGYARVAQTGTALSACAPLFGSLPGGTALHLAAAAAMLRQSTLFAAPVADGAPPELPVCRAASPGFSGPVLLTRLDCAGNAASIHLQSL